jgi:hypothetical protein
VEPNELLAKRVFEGAKINKRVILVSRGVAKRMTAKKSVKSLKNKITPETKQILVDAFDRLLVPLGFPSLQDGRKAVDEFLRKAHSEADSETVLSAADFERGALSSVVTTLLDSIENRAEPTQEELREILEKLKTLPFDIRALLDKTTKSMKRNLPHKPGGGRPDSLTLDQKIEACLKVGTLMGQGVGFRVALERVGRHFGVGARTIQRAWQKRAGLHNKAD